MNFQGRLKHAGMQSEKVAGAMAQEFISGLSGLKCTGNILKKRS